LHAVIVCMLHECKVSKFPGLNIMLSPSASQLFTAVGNSCPALTLSADDRIR
jgi:hypothetical protein